MMNLTKDDTFKLLIHDQVALLKMPSIFTLHQAQAFQEYFQQLFETKPSLKKIIFDFAGTEFLDSTGIGALSDNLYLAREKRIDWLCWSCSPEVVDYLKLAGIADDLRMKPGSDAVFVDRPRTRPSPIGQFPPSQANTIHPAYVSKMKRVIDIMGSLIGLGITALLLVPVAIAIKLEDPGPIFSRQLYRGYLGKPFWLWKFRSLTADGQKSEYQKVHEVVPNGLKNENSRHITGVGKFLIQNNLDELPRFWSVLLGEMSLVGSYPSTCKQFSGYGLKEWQCLNVKPGITGEWLIDNAFKFKYIDEVLLLDMQYQRQWNLGYDLKIMLKTIITLLSKDSE